MISAIVKLVAGLRTLVVENVRNEMGEIFVP